MNFATFEGWLEFSPTEKGEGVLGALPLLLCVERWPLR